MLSQRLLSSPRSLVSAPLLLRPFSTSRTALDGGPTRAPSIADITPGGGEAFDARQRDFRAKAAAAQRAREQQESQWVRRGGSEAGAAASVASTSSAASSSSSSHPPGLGSLSTHETEDQAAAAAGASEHTSKAKGALSSLIYGTKEGRQMDQEIERSYSQVLMRGKYVHSIVFHKVKPDKVDEYVALVGKWYPRMASMEQNKVNLVGSWRTEVGDCDTFGGCPIEPANERMMNRL